MATRKTTSKPKPKPVKKAAAPKDLPSDACGDPTIRTEAELFADVSEDVAKAWKKLRPFLTRLGSDQTAYTSNRSVMFKRSLLYAFVTPKRSSIELFILLPRIIDSELIKNFQSTKSRTCHMIRITHADQIEEPITDWLREAFDVNGAKE